MERPLKPEQRPDKGGPKYTLDVQNVKAVLDIKLIFGNKGAKENGKEPE